MVDRVRDAPPKPSTYRELLATRVLSVDAYWKELREPSRRTPREIPVPLWPGESLQQYEREFGRWLASRRLSLAAMREDPVIERNYRLQFAHTRVARTNARPRSRSRSRSRSPPRRHFSGAQQRPHSVPTQYKYERRPSSDNGHPLVARPEVERQRPDRNYSREPPQIGRTLTTEPEARREYDNWQAHRDPDARSQSYGPRVPPPRDAPRQHVGDTEHWNHSVSRLPQKYTNRAASPRNISRSSAQVRRSASPHDQERPSGDNVRSQLLARRVISVEAFRHEMYKLRNGFMREDDLKRPNETMVRIPVILWPGETMAQYTLKFERWLASRDIPLVSLRDNPAKERSLWHSFAYARAGTTESGEPIHPNATSRTPSRMSPRPRSRSRSRSSSRSIQRSSERGRPPMVIHHGKNSSLVKESAINADLLPRRERSYSPEQRHQAASSPSSIAPPENPRLLSNKTRRQLLERRILALEVFQQEVDHNPGAGVVGATEGNILPAIPVPLYPGESMGLYDHRFWTWLKDFNETKDSLRGNPAKERRFRMKFAYLRVNFTVKGLQSLTKAGDRVSVEAPQQSVEAHNKLPLGVLKSARARLAMHTKRSTDDKERENAASRDQPNNKRARTEAESENQVRAIFASNRSLVNAEQKKTTTLSLASYHALSRSSLAATANASATRASVVQISTESSVLTSNAASVRSSTLTSTTASSVPTPIAPSAPASTLLPTNKSSAPITIASSTRTVTHSPVGPVQRTTSSEIPASANIARSAASEQREPRAILAKPAASSKVAMAPSIPNSFQLSKTSPAPMSTPVTASTKSLTSTSRDEIAARNYVKLGVVNKMRKPVEATRKSSDSMAISATSTKKLPVLSSEASGSQTSWNRLAPTSVTLTSEPDPVAKPSTSSSSTLSATPALTTSKKLTASSQSSSTINISADVNSQAPSAVPSPAPLHRSISATRTTSTTANLSVNIVDNDSADTDGASSDPETALAIPTVNEVSDAESNPGDDDGEHDGDVMNPDGCCCNKCMRSWAKTLTDRMDQLEQNVENLKREVTGIVVT